MSMDVIQAWVLVIVAFIVLVGWVWQARQEKRPCLHVRLVPNRPPGIISPCAWRIPHHAWKGVPGQTKIFKYYKADEIIEGTGGMNIINNRFLVVSSHHPHHRGTYRSTRSLLDGSSLRDIEDVVGALPH